MNKYIYVLFLIFTFLYSSAQEIDNNVITNDTLNDTLNAKSILSKQDSIILNDTNTVYELFVKGNKNFIKGKYDEAYDLYNMVLQKDSLKCAITDSSLIPKRVWNDSFRVNKLEITNLIYNLLGLCLIYKEKYQDAIAYFNQIIETDSNYRNVFYNRGVAKFYMRNYKDAIQDFNTAEQKDSVLIEAYTANSLINNRLQNFVTAVKKADAGISYKNDAANLYFYRGFAKFYLREYENAIDDYTLAIENNSNFERAYYNRGVAKHRLDMFSEACLDWEKADNLGYSKAGETLQQLCK